MPEIFDSSKDVAEPRAAETAAETAVAQTAAPPKNRTHAKINPDEYSEVMRHERPATNALMAFLPKPMTMHFDSQSSTERILLLLRRHPVTQVPWILFTIFFAVLPLWWTTLPIMQGVPANYMTAAVVGWYVLLTGFILESFLSWFFNVYIITDERIIDVDFLSLIYKSVSSAKIDNIEDVTARSGGALQSIFNFGTVYIQTAGQKREFDFEDVPQPAKVTQLLNELILEEEREKIEGRVS